MEKYRYRLYCPICFQEDYMGCYGGGYDDWSNEFDTRKEAEDSAEEAIEDSMEKYEIQKIREVSNGE